VKVGDQSLQVNSKFSNNLMCMAEIGSVEKLCCL